jgi:hypothetical protein
MAEHTVQDHHLDLDAHQQAYSGFLRGSVALILHVAFVMVALCSFAFAARFSVFIGFAGLIIGTIAVLIDARAGSRYWFLSLAVLLIFGLITAINVS